MNPQQHISTPAMHLDPPATCFHPPPTCFHSQTQVSTTYNPPAVHFDPDWHPRHMFWPPMTSQPAFQPRLAPQALKSMYDCSHVCFSFCFFLFGFGNTCMSNHTHVSCVFIYLLFIFTLETHVRLLVHAFLMFLFIYYIFLPSKHMYEQSHRCFLVNTCMQVVVFNKIL